MLCHSDGCVLLSCLNAHPDIFAVMNCCVVALSVFSSDILNKALMFQFIFSAKDVRKWGIGLKKTLELDFLQKALLPAQRRLIVFAYIFPVNLST